MNEAKVLGTHIFGVAFDTSNVYRHSLPPLATFLVESEEGILGNMYVRYEENIFPFDHNMFALLPKAYMCSNL